MLKHYMMVSFTLLLHIVAYAETVVLQTTSQWQPVDLTSVKKEFGTSVKTLLVNTSSTHDHLQATLLYQKEKKTSTIDGFEKTFLTLMNRKPDQECRKVLSFDVNDTSSGHLYLIERKDPHLFVYQLIIPTKQFVHSIAMTSDAKHWHKNETKYLDILQTVTIQNDITNMIEDDDIKYEIKQTLSNPTRHNNLQKLTQSKLNKAPFNNTFWLSLLKNALPFS